MDARVGFHFVLNAVATQRGVSSKCLMQETQVSYSISLLHAVVPASLSIGLFTRVMCIPCFLILFFVEKNVKCVMHWLSCF